MTRLAALDLNLLLVLDALFEERSVTRAARRVGITQPALSNALARLRVQLNDPLFVRSGRGVVPTARAAEIEPLLRAALRQIESALEDQRFDAAVSRRVFRLMTTDSMEVVLLPALLRRTQTEAPDVDFVLVPPPLRKDGARAALEQDEVDLAVGVAVEDGGGIVGVPLYTEPFLGLARKGHPLLSGRMTLERWAAQRHVLVAPRGGRTGYVDTALAEAGLKRRIQVRTAHFASAAPLLVGSDLVLTMPARAARLFAATYGLATFTPPIALPALAIPLRWHERHARDEGHRWLRRLIADVARSL